MEERRGIIYCVTNKVNGKMYVGQTIKTLEERMKRHIYDSGVRQHIYLYRAMSIYGTYAFSWKILEKDVPVSQLNDLEILYIDLLDTYLTGYNMTYGGDATFGRVPSEETKRKIGRANSGENSYWYGKKRSAETCKAIGRGNKGKEVSAGTRKKLSEANSGENSPWWGKEHSEETKEKIRQARLGAKASEETRRKIGEASRGRKHSEEAKRKMSASRSGDKNHFYGKHHTEETLNKQRIPIHQLDLDGNFIKRWGSAAEASATLGICSSMITAVMRNRRQSSGGFKWEYADNQHYKE